MRALGYRPAWQALRTAGAELVPLFAHPEGIAGLPEAETLTGSGAIHQAGPESGARKGTPSESVQ